MAFRKSLKNLLSAKVPAIYIETTEWERFYAELDRVKDDRIVKRWNPLDDEDFVDFVKSTATSEDKNCIDKNCIVVVEYADCYLNDDQAASRVAVLLRKLRELNQQIIFVAPTLCLPKSISNEVAVLDLPLPSRAEIKIESVHSRIDFHISRKLHLRYDIDITQITKCEVSSVYEFSIVR